MRNARSAATLAGGLLIVCLLCGTEAPGFTSDSDVTVVREMMEEAAPGDTVSIELTVTIATAFDNNTIRGFYITDQVDSDLTVDNQTTVYINDIIFDNATIEAGSIGEVFGTAFPYRCTLETPPGFAQGNALVGGDELTFHYEITIPDNATGGTEYDFPGYSWVGRIKDSDNQTVDDIFGYEELPGIVLSVVIERFLTLHVDGSGSVAKDPDYSSYDNGTTVQLTANPGSGYSFASWSGDASGSDNPETIVMDADKTVTATFTINVYTLSVTKNGAGTGTVSSDPAGIDCGPDCSETYGHDTAVTLSAAPDTGSTFAGWSGSGCSGTGTCQVTMDGNKSVTASFTPSLYTLSVTADNGTVAKDPDQATYAHGTTVQLTATADVGYTFSSWSGDASGSDNPTSLFMDDNKTVTANFTPSLYTLSVTADNGTVAKDPDQATYAHGTTVQLTATADVGYTFSSWSGDASGSDNPTSLFMDDNKTVTALFTANGYALAINADNGTVTRNPDKAVYGYGESVELTATPAAGYYFSSWSGDASGSDNPATVIMDDNKTVTASFSRKTTRDAIESKIKNLKEGTGGVTADDVKAIINSYMEGH